MKMHIPAFLPRSLVVSALLLLTGPVLAQDSTIPTGGEEISAGPDPEMASGAAQTDPPVPAPLPAIPEVPLAEVAASDQVLSDTRRLLDLVTMLVQLRVGLGEIHPNLHPDSMLTLLDGNRPVEERLRRVLELRGDPVPETATAQSGGSLSEEAALRIQSLEDEVDQTRRDVEVLFAALPVVAVDSQESFEPGREWELDRSSVQYVQLPAAGSNLEPAVWLTAGGDEGARVGVGESVRLEGRTIRLAKLESGPGNRVRLHLAVDGDPVEIDW